METRSVSRDSLFLLATIRVEQDDTAHRVRVRNLSDGGMMAEGNVKVQRGNRLRIEMRNVDEVQGSVAWVQDDRFGISFDSDIDARLVREPAKEPADQQTTKASNSKEPRQSDLGSLRKV